MEAATALTRDADVLVVQQKSSLGGLPILAWTMACGVSQDGGDLWGADLLLL